MTITDVIATYAAAVASGALALEVRRWFETGARLRLTVMARAKIVGVTDDDREFLMLRVTNIGDRPTTLNLMCTFEFRTIFHRWARRSNDTGIIAHPGIPGVSRSTPHVLAPGEEWGGVAIYDDELRDRVRRGHFFVGIVATHSRRTAVARVHWQDAKDRLGEADA